MANNFALSGLVFEATSVWNQTGLDHPVFRNRTFKPCLHGEIATAGPEDYVALTKAMNFELARTWDNQNSWGIYVNGALFIAFLWPIKGYPLLGAKHIQPTESRYDTLPDLFQFFREGAVVEYRMIDWKEKHRLVEEALPEKVRNCELRKVSPMIKLEPYTGQGATPVYPGVPVCEVCGAAYVTAFSSRVMHP